MRVTEKTTISEIVRESYNTAELFEKNRIDFCCGGDNSLEKACQKAGVDTGKIIPELESLMEEGDWDSRYVERLPLDELCDYIMGRHHTYINEKSPFIKQKLNKIAEVHGDNHPELHEVKKMFEAALSNLEAHMKKEELLVFPYIKKMVTFSKEGVNKPEEFGDFNISVSLMLNEHQTEGDRFNSMALITKKYTVPSDGCTTYEVTYKSLAEFERDLHRHIHLENNVLFPKALELEKTLINK